MTKFLNISTDTTLGGNSASNEIVSSQKAVKDYVDSHSGGTSLPAGIIMEFAGTTAPAGWLVCDGSAVSRTTYADLFAAIGTTYGAGDGSTTFNLPNKSAYTGAVIGNGMTMGLMENSTTFAGLVANVNGIAQARIAQYGASVGTAPSGTELSSASLGLTTDGTKSGVICETDNNIKVIIKY